jgi:hypothetical protein
MGVLVVTGGDASPVLDPAGSLFNPVSHAMERPVKGMEALSGLGCLG